MEILIVIKLDDPAEFHKNSLCVVVNQVYKRRMLYVLL